MSAGANREEEGGKAYVKLAKDLDIGVLLERLQDRPPLGKGDGRRADLDEEGAWSEADWT